MKWLVLALALSACWSKPERIPDEGIDNPVELVAGRKHACVIVEGKLRCWGKNDHGQLGERPELRTGMPAAVDADDKLWTWIAAGDAHTCGITSDNKLYCWGDDSSGQIGDGNMTTLAHQVEIQLPDSAEPEKIYAGYAATCAIDFTKHLYCWGVYDSIDGVAHKTPTHVLPGGKDGPWRSIAIGEHHVCALNDDDNQAYCWGKNMYGELGVPDDHPLDGAQPKSDREFIALAAGPQATCGVTIDRKLVCFGNPANGLLGAAPDAARHEDVLVDETEHWSTVSMGRFHTCGIADSAAYCFGDDDRGALGTFDPSRNVPSDSVHFAYRAVSGESFSCGRTEDGVVCWGSNSDGELGNGEIATAWAPEEITMFSGPQIVVAGDGHSCMVDNGSTSREVWCWGDNRKGQVVKDGAPFVLSPVKIEIAGGALDTVVAGSEHTCARSPVSDKDLYCWGSNTSNQLGNAAGHLDRSTLPGSTGQGWANLAAGDHSTCAVDTTGQLFCWGDLPGTTRLAQLPMKANGTFKGEPAVGGGMLLAQDNTSGDTRIFGADPNDSCAADESFPVSNLLSTGTGSNEVVHLALSTGGGHHGCRLRVDPMGTASELLCWGNNDFGQTGAPLATDGTCARTSPVLGPAVGWANQNDGVGRGVATAGNHTCAIDRNHVLSCWGESLHGETGELTPPSNLPHALPGGWRYIASGPSHMCAISTDTSRFYCWGENRFGEVGNGKMFHPTPVTVIGL